MNKLKMSISFLVLFFFNLTIVAQVNCKKVKTGSFIIKDSVKNVNFLIERNDSIEIQTNLDDKSIVNKYKITWLSKCKYDLVLFEGDFDLMKYYADKTTHVCILKCDKNGYEFSVQRDNGNINHFKADKVLK